MFYYFFSEYFHNMAFFEFHVSAHSYVNINILRNMLYFGNHSDIFCGKVIQHYREKKPSRWERFPISSKHFTLKRYIHMKAYYYSYSNLKLKFELKNSSKKQNSSKHSDALLSIRSTQ